MGIGLVPNDNLYWSWKGLCFNTPENVTLMQEIFYYTGKARSVSTENLTKESMSLKGVANPDEATLASLTGESGPLAAGALPQMDVSQADGDKHAWESLMDAPLAKRKAKPRNTQEPAAPVEPKTLQEYSSQLFTNCSQEMQLQCFLTMTRLKRSSHNCSETLHKISKRSFL